jgi:hypothetical protein
MLFEDMSNNAERRHGEHSVSHTFKAVYDEARVRQAVCSERKDLSNTLAFGQKISVK